MAARVRDRVFVGPASGQMKSYRISNNAYTTTYHHTPEGPLDRCGSRRIERIAEDRTVKPKNSKTPYVIKYTNNVNHLVTDIKWTSWAGIRYYGTTYYYLFSGMMFLDRTPYRVFADNLNLVRNPPESFNSRAFQAMYPDLETSLSLSNFVVELRDIKRLVGFLKEWKQFKPAMKKAAKTLKQLRSVKQPSARQMLVADQLGKSVRNSRIATASRFLAETHLSYKFGIKPFIADVIKLVDILTDHQKRIDDFLAKRNTLQKRYYSEREPWSESTSSWVDFVGGISADYRYKTRYKSKDVATMTYEYTCPDLDSFSLKIKALRDQLGLRLTPSVIWESIPFSFVVDWFFRVQDFLEANEDPLIKATVVVHDYSVSRKLEFVCEREWRYWAAPGGSTLGYHTDSCHSGTSYIRRRTQPDAENTFINRGQYGLNQLALSASLLRCNLSRR